MMSPISSTGRSILLVSFSTLTRQLLLRGSCCGLHQLSSWRRHCSGGQTTSVFQGRPSSSSSKKEVSSSSVSEASSSSSSSYIRRSGLTLSKSTSTFKEDQDKAKNKIPYRRRKLTDMSWTKEPIDERLIWVDCEMTGLDLNKEMIMEIGCVITDKDLNEVASQPSMIIHVPDDKLQGMVEWCQKHHGESGLTESCRQSKLTSEEVDETLFDFVSKYTTSKECPMAGNSIYMDRLFISKQFPKFHSHFHYRNVDVSSVKELVRRWYPGQYAQLPKKKWSHRVLDDIKDSIQELKYYRSSVFVQSDSKKCSEAASN